MGGKSLAAPGWVGLEVGRWVEVPVFGVALLVVTPPVLLAVALLVRLVAAGLVLVASGMAVDGFLLMPFAPAAYLLPRLPR